MPFVLVPSGAGLLGLERQPTLHNTFGGYHHKRMAGRSMSEHVNAMRRYRNAVADLL